MSNFQIRKDRPIPEITYKNRYPFRQMEVGDSFTAPSNAVRAAASVASRRLGKRFIVRRVSDELICWRVE